MTHSVTPTGIGTLSATPPAEALIGPNAVIQTLAAVRAIAGNAACDAVARIAELPQRDPQEMIPEAWFVRLVAAVREGLGPADARAVLALSGEKTADYVATNRIPGPFRALLRLLPERLAIPLLLAAFGRHAWTFAGNGAFRVSGRYPGSIVLSDAPTCRRLRDNVHTGGYYEAAFQGLLSLASPGVEVKEVECRSLGDPHCQFRIRPGKHHNRG